MYYHPNIGYGSIAIDTMDVRMNTHLFTSYFDVNYRGTGFWPIPISYQSGDDRGDTTVWQGYLPVQIFSSVIQGRRSTYQRRMVIS